MNDDAIRRALFALHDPRCSGDVRERANAYLVAFKASEPLQSVLETAWRMYETETAAIVSSPIGEPRQFADVVRHFAFHVLIHCVAKRAALEDERLLRTLQDFSLLALERKVPEESPFVERNAIKLVGEIAKRTIPARWPDFFAKTLAMFGPSASGDGGGKQDWKRKSRLYCDVMAGLCEEVFMEEHEPLGGGGDEEGAEEEVRGGGGHVLDGSRRRSSLIAAAAFNAAQRAAVLKEMRKQSFHILPAMLQALERSSRESTVVEAETKSAQLLHTSCLELCVRLLGWIPFSPDVCANISSLLQWLERQAYFVSSSSSPPISRGALLEAEMKTLGVLASKKYADYGISTPTGGVFHRLLAAVSAILSGAVAAIPSLEALSLMRVLLSKHGAWLRVNQENFIRTLCVGFVLRLASREGQRMNPNETVEALSSTREILSLLVAPSSTSNNNAVVSPAFVDTQTMENVGGLIRFVYSAFARASREVEDDDEDVEWDEFAKDEVMDAAKSVIGRDLAGNKSRLIRHAFLEFVERALGTLVLARGTNEPSPSLPPSESKVILSFCSAAMSSFPSPPLLTLSGEGSSPNVDPPDETLKAAVERCFETFVFSSPQGGVVEDRNLRIDVLSCFHRFFFIRSGRYLARILDALARGMLDGREVDDDRGGVVTPAERRKRCAIHILKTVKALPPTFQREMYPILVNFSRANAGKLSFPQLSIATEAMGICASAYPPLDSPVMKMVEILTPCLEILYDDVATVKRVVEYVESLERADFDETHASGYPLAETIEPWEERGFLMDVIKFTPDPVRSFYCALMTLCACQHGKVVRLPDEVYARVLPNVATVLRALETGWGRISTPTPPWFQTIHPIDIRLLLSERGAHVMSEAIEGLASLLGSTTPQQQATGLGAKMGAVGFCAGFRASAYAFLIECAFHERLQINLSTNPSSSEWNILGMLLRSGVFPAWEENMENRHLANVLQLILEFAAIYERKSRNLKSKAEMLTTDVTILWTIHERLSSPSVTSSFAVKWNPRYGGEQGEGANDRSVYREVLREAARTKLVLNFSRFLGELYPSFSHRVKTSSAVPRSELESWRQILTSRLADNEGKVYVVEPWGDISRMIVPPAERAALCLEFLSHPHSSGASPSNALFDEGENKKVTDHLLVYLAESVRDLVAKNVPPLALASSLYETVTKLKSPRPMAHAANTAERLFAHFSNPSEFSPKHGESRANFEKRTRDNLLLMLTAELGLMELSAISAASALFLTSHRRKSEVAASPPVEEEDVDSTTTNAARGMDNNKNNHGDDDDELIEVNEDADGDGNLLELLFKKTAE